MAKDIVVGNIGWCVAKLDKDPNCPHLNIVSPADASGDFYRPAESVSVYGKHAVSALRDFLNEHFPKESNA